MAIFFNLQKNHTLNHQTHQIKIAILDDHPMITEGITRLLKNNPEFILSSIAHSWSKMINNLESEASDILVLDLNIKGMNVAKNITNLKHRFPAIKILVFSSYNTPSIVKKVLAQNVDGYLLKDTTQSEIVEALCVIADGENYIGKRVAVPKKETNNKIKLSEIKDDFEKKTNLTKRELEVLQLVCQGIASKEIAGKLFISHHTVQSHRKNIIQKLDLHSVAELVQFSLKNGLIG